jgi:hypothetical protein
MIQLYSLLPDDFCGGGMCYDSAGYYVTVYDAQRLLNREYAEVEFYLESVSRDNTGIPICRGLPDDVVIITCHGIRYCDGRVVQRHLDELRTYVEFLGEHTPTVGASAKV